MAKEQRPRDEDDPTIQRDPPGDEQPELEIPELARASGEGRAGPENAARLASRIAELEARLAEAQRLLEMHALERTIEMALQLAGVIDVEAGRLLVERALADHPEWEVEEAVADVRRRKPFLFAQDAPWAHDGASQAARGVAPASGSGAVELASTALASGDRNDLMRYLRARRAG